MLFTALVLVSVNGEHDSLQQLIDFSHCDETAQMRNMSRFALQQKKQIAVFLRLFIIREGPFRKVGGVVQVASDFFSLQ